MCENIDSLRSSVMGCMSITSVRAEQCAVCALDMGTLMHCEI